jgi:hypothetical protein
MADKQNENKDKEYYLSLVFCLIMIGRAMTASQDEHKIRISRPLSFTGILPDKDLKSDDCQADEGDSEEPHSILRVQLVRRTCCNL